MGIIKVSRDECSEQAWQLLGQRSEKIAELEGELVKAYKRLCKYEGHLGITDPEGRTWCEMCQEEITSGVQIRMRAIHYTFMSGQQIFETQVPNYWTDDALAEILAFRAGANPGDSFQLIEKQDGTYDVIATGMNV